MNTHSHAHTQAHTHTNTHRTTPHTHTHTYTVYATSNTIICYNLYYIDLPVINWFIKNPE